MVNVALSIGQLAVALALVALNGFFVAAEFAFVRVRETAVDQLAAAGRTGSSTLQGVMDDLDDYLAVTQLGITIASLGLGWVGEPAVAALIEPVIGGFLPAGLVHLVAFAVGFSIITFLHVVFGELAPKTIAISKADRLALLVAPPMKLFYYLFYPGIVLFNGTANVFTRSIGVPPASETEETLDEREIRRVLARSGRQGAVDAAEVEMIEGVFELDDTTVKEVMVPRPDVTTVDGDATVEELRATVGAAGHTRYPVLDEEDAILGFVDVKDAFTADDPHRPAADLARDLYLVPESTSIADLLARFREEKLQVAGVIDEWGAFEGFLTVEDVVEAVVGDIRDTFDSTDTVPVQAGEEGRYTIDGAARLEVVEQDLNVRLEAEDYETVAGVLIDRLGRAPAAGDTVEIEGYRFTVIEVEGTRISRIEAVPIE